MLGACTGGSGPFTLPLGCALLKDLPRVNLNVLLGVVLATGVETVEVALLMIAAWFNDLGVLGLVTFAAFGFLLGFEAAVVDFLGGILCQVVAL